MMRKTVGMLITILILLCAVGITPSWASYGESQPQDRVEAWMGRHHLQSAFGKLGRGLSNFLLGWLEIPLNVGKRYTASDTVGSTLGGVAIGAFKGAIRTGIGLYETVTFLVPYPEHYAPILPTLEYFQKTTKRKRLPLE